MERHGMMDSIDFHLTIDDSYRQTNSNVFSRISEDGSRHNMIKAGMKM